VKGIVIIGHGRSNAKAIKNAIALSHKFITEKVLEKISEEMEKMQSLFKELTYV
jgi:glycerol-3-phosphate acyltransferase PlsX